MRHQEYLTTLNSKITYHQFQKRIKRNYRVNLEKRIKLQLISIKLGEIMFVQAFTIQFVFVHRHALSLLDTVYY